MGKRSTEWSARFLALRSSSDCGQCLPPECCSGLACPRTGRLERLEPRVNEVRDVIARVATHPRRRSGRWHARRPEDGGGRAQRTSRTIGIAQRDRRSIERGLENGRSYLCTIGCGGVSSEGLV